MNRSETLGDANMPLAEFITELWTKLRENNSVQFSLPRISGGYLNFVIAFVGATAKEEFPKPPLDFNPPDSKSQVN